MCVWAKNSSLMHTEVGQVLDQGVNQEGEVWIPVERARSTSEGEVLRSLSKDLQWSPLEGWRQEMGE